MRTLENGKMGIVDALSHSTRRVRGIEFGKSLHVFKGFVIHTAVIIIVYQNLCRKQNKHARSIRCIFITIFQKVFHLRNKETASIVKFCQARNISRTFDKKTRGVERTRSKLQRRRVFLLNLGPVSQFRCGHRAGGERVAKNGFDLNNSLASYIFKAFGRIKKPSTRAEICIICI